MRWSRRLGRLSPARRFVGWGLAQAEGQLTPSMPEGSSTTAAGSACGDLPPCPCRRQVGAGDRHHAAPCGVHVSRNNARSGTEKQRHTAGRRCSGGMAASRPHPARARPGGLVPRCRARVFWHLDALQQVAAPRQRRSLSARLCLRWHGARRGTGSGGGSGANAVWCGAPPPPDTAPPPTAAARPCTRSRADMRRAGLGARRISLSRGAAISLSRANFKRRAPCRHSGSARGARQCGCRAGVDLERGHEDGWGVGRHVQHRPHPEQLCVGTASADICRSCSLARCLRALPPLPG